MCINFGGGSLKLEDLDLSTTQKVIGSEGVMTGLAISTQLDQP